MQNEMSSQGLKQDLDAMVDHVLETGHIDGLAKALHMAHETMINASVTSGSSQASPTVEVVRFLMDGGANSSLTTYLNRLWLQTTPSGSSTGAGGVSLKTSKEGFIKAILPGLEKHVLLKAVAVSSQNPNAYEIMSQVTLSNLGYDFYYSRDFAYMFTPGPNRKRIPMVKDTSSGLWMIDIPIVINDSSTSSSNSKSTSSAFQSLESDVLVCDKASFHALNNEVYDMEEDANPPSLLERNDDDNMIVAEEEEYNDTDTHDQMCTDEASDDATDDISDVASDDASSEEPNDLPEHLQILSELSQTDYSKAPILFFSKRDPYFFLSNFYPSTFAVDSHTFTSMEQWIMYRKAILMGDTESGNKILRENDPHNVKNLGRAVQPFNEELWNAERYDVLLEGLRIKFKSDAHLEAQLIGTSPRPLGEASQSDAIWGIGRSINDELAQDCKEWATNLQGSVLQVVRQELKETSLAKQKNYWQSLESYATFEFMNDQNNDQVIFNLDSEEAAYALRILIDKLEENIDNILAGLLNLEMEDKWVLWLFPTPFKGDEEQPQTWLEHGSQNNFIEQAPESYFDMICILEERIIAEDYGILKIFSQKHIPRLRTFAKWFSGRKKVPVNSLKATMYGKIFLDRKASFDKFLATLRYALWPTESKHEHLRQSLLDIETFSKENYKKKKPFKTLDGTEHKVTERTINSVQGQGLRSYLELHRILGHVSDEILWRTIQGSNVDISGKKKISAHCPVCNKLKLCKKSRPANSLQKTWATPNHDVVHRDFHGPLSTGIHGEQFWEVFVSASCRMCWVFVCKRKSDAYANFQAMAEIYKKKGRQLVIIVNDNAKEYNSEKMKKLFKLYHTEVMPMPEFIKNGNLAEVWNMKLELRSMANLLEGHAHQQVWPYAVKYSSFQLNVTVVLSSPIVMLHYLSPKQIWELPNHIISKIYSDMLDGTLDLNKVTMLVDKNNFVNMKPFWSLASIRNTNVKPGNVSATGLAKPGTYVYVGPADNNKSSYKLLNLADLSTIESALVKFESRESQHDILTGFDRIGGAANSERPSLSKQIRRNFDIEGESLNPNGLMIEEEQQASASLSDPVASDHMEIDDQAQIERLTGQSEKEMTYLAPEESITPSSHTLPSKSSYMNDESEDDSEEEQVQKDHSGDLKLHKEMDLRSEDFKVIPDNEIRQKVRIAESKGVSKAPIRASNSEAASEIEDTDNTSEYLNRYRLANLPISFIEENPKRRNTKSYDRYEKYKYATTIESALTAGAVPGDIAWDYNRGFLRCIHGAETRRLNPLVQRCMDDGYEKASRPEIGSVVTMFSVESSHPAFAKQGKIIDTAPQRAVINNYIHTFSANRKEDDNDISTEEELCDNPRKETLFFSKNPNTDKTDIFYCNLNEEHIPYVPTINQLANGFETDPSPPTVTDDSLHPSDRLYIFETLSDEENQFKSELFVAPLKAFVEHSSSSTFISREAAIDEGSACIKNLLEDVGNRYEWLAKHEAKLPKLRDLVNAVSEGTKDLTRTFGDSPFYINNVERVERKETIPTKWDNAMILNPEKWGPSMTSEIEQLINLGTWVLVPISSLKKGSSNITGTTWAFRIKSDGRYRSRLCAQGFTQRWGIDFWDVYSSVATIESIRVAIALAAANKRRLSTFDVKNAFQNTDLPDDEEVHCKQAPGFDVDPNNPKESNRLLMEWYKSLGLEIPSTIDSEDKLVLKLRKALQGLKASGRYFQQTLFAWLFSKGFTQLKTDDCCWVYKGSNGSVSGGSGASSSSSSSGSSSSKSDGSESNGSESSSSGSSGHEMIDLNIYIYVDDILVSAADETSENYFEKMFLERWKGSQGSGGLATALLGMSIYHLDGNRILLNQSLMIEDIAHTFKATTESYPTPMAEKFDPSFDDTKPPLDTEQYNYRSLCGALLFVVTHTRPDCSCAMSMLCSAMSKPQQKHWDAAIRLANYLYETKDLGLCYSMVEDNMMNKIYAMVDASWAAEKGARSRGGYLIKLNGASVCYRSKLINTICLSSAESETTAAVACLKDVVWLRMHLFELGYIQDGSTPVYEDNTATISSASGNSQRKESRYYQMRTAFIRQLVKSGTMHFVYVSTEDQAADALSKNLAPTLFLRHQPTILGAQPHEADGHFSAQDV